MADDTGVCITFMLLFNGATGVEHLKIQNCMYMYQYFPRQKQWDKHQWDNFDINGTDCQSDSLLTGFPHFFTNKILIFFQLAH